MFSQGVLWTVLSQTDFGKDWLARFVFACVACRRVRSFPVGKGNPIGLAQGGGGRFGRSARWQLAFAGHAIGGQGVEGIVHPAADILHLIAAAAWVGALVPLALLLAMTKEDAGVLAVARTATLRFSTLGIVSVATILSPASSTAGISSAA